MGYYQVSWIELGYGILSVSWVTGYCQGEFGWGIKRWLEFVYRILSLGLGYGTRHCQVNF